MKSNNDNPQIDHAACCLSGFLKKRRKKAKKNKEDKDSESMYVLQLFVAILFICDK